jgi:hypothetical protein
MQGKKALFCRLNKMMLIKILQEGFLPGKKNLDLPEKAVETSHISFIILSDKVRLIHLQ